MRKWGVLISVFYALIVLGVLVPVGIMLVGKSLQDLPKLPQTLLEVYQEWATRKVLGFAGFLWLCWGFVFLATCETLRRW